MKRQKRKNFQLQGERRCRRSVSHLTKREDLVVNRNRLSDISDWLDCAVVSQHVSLLLLSGPSGCGKTATIRVLAVERGIEVVEWSTPVDSFDSWESTEWLRSIKVSVKFKEFLLGVGRYCSVIASEFECSRKIIIVKDFPSSFLTNPDEFWQIIDLYVLKGLVPIVFICTDSPNKKSKDIAYELFPEDFKVKHGIVQVSFLPVPVTSVVKALKQVVQLKLLSVRDDMIKELAHDCQGDIGKALNNLMLLSVASGAGGDLKKAKQRKGTMDDKRSKVSREDDSAGLFHSVGRILYAKRQPSFPHSESNLVHKPADIVKQFSHYANQVVSLAHCNYLDVFSSIECITRAATYLSDADIIMSEWREKELLTTVGFSVAVAGFMESNVDPVKRFRPIHGAKWAEDTKAAVVNHNVMHDIFSNFSPSKLITSLEVTPLMMQMWKAQAAGKASVRWCPHGFLPHKTDELVSALGKIKSDMLSNSSQPTFSSQCSDGEDDPIHISDVSD